MTPREHFTWMVRKGMINARGQVTKLIGGSAEPEPNFESWMPESTGPARQPNSK